MGESQTERTQRILAGRYRLLRLLGSGGMGQVHLAEDEVLHRRVAVKLLLPQHADDPRFIERFRREARAAAALSNPHVVAVHDLGEDKGTPYIVMQYVEGETLRDVLRRRGRLPEAEALAICRQVLEAAAHAHGRGVVHRDLTPRNILIDERGRTLVSDFGIARLAAGSCTTGGVLLGTVPYASPEQVRGAAVDHRSDIYTVGVVLFEMLTGRPPFEGDDPLAVALCHVQAPAPAPSSLAPGISPHVERAILTAMAKDPGDRFPSAAAFTAALGMPGEARVGSGADAGGEARQSAVDHTTVVAPRPSEGETQLAGEARTAVSSEPARRSRPRFSRRRLAWAALAVAAVVAAGVLALLLPLLRPIPVPDTIGESRSVAVALLDDRGLSAAVSTGYTDGQRRGFVYRQSPAPQQDVRRGGTVRVWVSKGALHIAAPDLAGLEESEAERTLTRLGLVGSRLEGRSDEVAAGRVYRQEPAVAARIARGQAVSYWVSTGFRGVAVADVGGTFYLDAVDALEEQGLVVDVRPSLGWGDVPLAVIDQQPAAGTRVERGSTVVIWVAVL